MSKHNPLVSIVCTNYNKGVWIREAIESFLKQKTNFEYEILLIDDKSTDKSPEIIKEYAKRYPRKIRAFYNEKNLGITRTWKKICKEAKGKYIARCDGDDYWIDNHKLQKQVTVLEGRKDAKWCCTDYDIATAEGTVTHHAAVKTGLINRPKSYAEMLATKGITMSSTWLVETHLMLEVDEELDDMAVDDTFNIQLDLFNKTSLIYLPDSTAVFRINAGSDSRPVDMNNVKDRARRLLKTQLEYVEKYKGVDDENIIKELLYQSMRDDQVANERLQLINQQKTHIELQDDSIRKKDKQISDIISSKRYKIGNIFVSPIIFLKSMIERGKHKCYDER